MQLERRQRRMRASVAWLARFELMPAMAWGRPSGVSTAHFGAQFAKQAAAVDFR